MKQLNDKVALVSGAARGIGLETCKEFARRGAVSVLLDINARRLETALAEVKAIDERAASYVLDVTDKAAWLNVVKDVQARFGSVDILVNNAAIQHTMPFEEVSEALWDQVMAVNAKGVLFGAQAVSDIMRRQKSGRIINLASEAGKNGGLVIGVHYSASKAAVICMTKTFAKQLAKDNVTANCVAPGIIRTEFIEGVPGVENFFKHIPLGGMPGQASDVARAIAFLASDDARYITGEILDVNGGLIMD